MSQALLSPGLQQRISQQPRIPEQQFQLLFFPTNMEADAINALEGTSYHQGNWTVDDYLDSF